MSRQIVGSGTPESAWAGWLTTLPALDLGCRHVVVVAPHPDDETLGVGGTLALLREAGAEIEVLALTDGERGTPSGALDRTLAERRPQEVSEALRTLLGCCPPVRRLRIPDGEVRRARARIAAELRELLRPESWCLVTHRDDGHPDHESAFAAAADACSAVGARLLEYPVWLWHWAHPSELDEQRQRLRRIDLPEQVLERKRNAIAAFGSQTAGGATSVLPPTVLDRFLRPFEVLAA